MGIIKALKKLFGVSNDEPSLDKKDGVTTRTETVEDNKEGVATTGTETVEENLIIKEDDSEVHEEIKESKVIQDPYTKEREYIINTENNIIYNILENELEEPKAKYQKEELKIKIEIIKILLNNIEQMCIKNVVIILEKYSHQRIGILIRQMVADEKVERIEINGRAYFKVKDSYIIDLYKSILNYLDNEKLCEFDRDTRNKHENIADENNDNYDEVNEDIDDAIEKQKAELIGPNGRINALYLAELFQKDLIFFNDGEIEFDGNRHYMNGLQFNSAVANEYPVVIQNAQTVANGLNDVINFIEQNSKLQLPLDDINEELHGFLLEEDMTALTLMNLFSYKLLMISKKDESSIFIMADTRVTTGIPNGEEFIKELIRSLLKYNDINTSAMEIIVLGMRNFDV